PNVVSNSSLDPALELGETYYWRIDEVNETDDTMIKGRIWNFKVANYIVIDDMESYSSSNKIFVTWLDYYDLSNSNAEIRLETNPPYVRDGSSMEFVYDNTNEYGSWTEAEVAKLPIPYSDWTVADVKALVLYFYGDPLNSATVNDKMYVALDDGTTIAASIYPDINDIKDESWHEWNIDLVEDFNVAGGVNLANVSKMHIGFGGELFTGQSADGGSGTVWFDDIRIWLQRCVPDVAYHYGDVTGECFIDGFDIEAMSYDWLTSDYNVMVSVPSDTNLIGWWKFDEGTGNTVEDSSAYSNNGVTMDLTPKWVEGYPGDPYDSAMYFNGINDYVTCATRTGTEPPGTYPAELMPDTFTVSCWTKLDGFAYYAGFVGNGIDGEAGFYLYNVEGNTEDEGTFGLSMRTEPDWQDVQPPDIYEIDTWYHLAATYDGNYANFYVDGVLVEGPQDVEGPMRWIDEDSNYPNNFTIGSFEENEFAWGAIDEVRYYNYALPHGEVAYLAGLEGEQYVPLKSAANLVPRVPDPAVDRQYYPENPDIVNFTDFGLLADSWLNEILFP
ncbi:MAG: LamG domain-containing protein, partial [Sedimentisphaerales bacterium]|nr:LamG domain-containing protein [Sedimentisphaerales bacterium]